MVVNHLPFADDMCTVFGSSLSDLQRLLNMCCDYAVEDEIVFKRNKRAGTFSPCKA